MKNALFLIEMRIPHVCKSPNTTRYNFGDTLIYSTEWTLKKWHVTCLKHECLRTNVRPWYLTFTALTRRINNHDLKAVSHNYLTDHAWEAAGRQRNIFYHQSRWWWRDLKVQDSKWSSFGYIDRCQIYSLLIKTDGPLWLPTIVSKDSRDHGNSHKVQRVGWHVKDG